MNPQIIKDSNGADAGVFIPKQDWDLLQSIYPHINTISKNLPQWQKDIIDNRLDAIAKDSKRLKPIADLFLPFNK